jgi:prepilin-type processing-associated H-X9-DG protein
VSQGWSWECGGPALTCYISFGSWHPGICEFAFCDGHVKAVSTATDLVVLSRLAVRDDGQPIPDY